MLEQYLLDGALTAVFQLECVAWCGNIHYIGNDPYGISRRRIVLCGGLIARFHGQPSRHISYADIDWGGVLGGNVVRRLCLLKNIL